MQKTLVCWIPDPRKTPGEGNGTPLQYSCLENSTGCIGSQSQTRLSNFPFAPWKESYDKSRQHIEKQRHHFGWQNQSCGIPSSHVLTWELDHKESWALKNWCFQTVVLKKTLESPVDCKDIKPVNPKGNQPWIFTWRTDAKGLIFWPPDVKHQLTGKDPDAGKDQRQKLKGAAEDEVHR